MNGASVGYHIWMAPVRSFDREVKFDPRSRAFPIAPLIKATRPRSYTWACNKYLDQGSEGACVGFSWSHELAATPVAVPGITNASALELYHAAQRLDDWAGEDYSGTSVLAGAKAVKAAGHMEQYRWAFSLQDLIMAIGYQGPAVLGINWYEGMFTPNNAGFILPTGEIAGGHAILCQGVNVVSRKFLLHNSWGSRWGRDGCAWVSYETMSKLLREQGEACIPVLRS